MQPLLYLCFIDTPTAITLAPLMLISYYPFTYPSHILISSSSHFDFRILSYLEYNVLHPAINTPQPLLFITGTEENIQSHHGILKTFRALKDTLQTSRARIQSWFKGA